MCYVRRCHKSKRTRLNGGEVLVGVVGSIGKIGIAPPSWAGANIVRAVARIVPSQNTSAEYLSAMLKAPRAQAYMLDTTRTLAQPTLNIGQLKKTPIPILPLSKQEILVSRVRESGQAFTRLKKVQSAAGRSDCSSPLHPRQGVQGRAIEPPDSRL